jgi:hypothetical protein
MNERITVRQMLEGHIPDGASQNMLTPEEMTEKVQKGLGIDNTQFGFMIATRLMKNMDFNSLYKYMYDAYDATKLMQYYCEPEQSVPEIIRKKEKMFNGQPGLYWIMNGRIDDVALAQKAIGDGLKLGITSLEDKDQIKKRYPLD